MPILWGDYLAKAFKNNGFVRWPKGEAPQNTLFFGPISGRCCNSQASGILNLGFLQNSDLILAIVRIIRDSNWAIKENCPKTKVFDLLKIENTLSFQWIIGSPENGGKGLMDVLKSGGKRWIFGECPSFTPMFSTEEFSVDRVLEWIIMRGSFFKCESLG